MHACVCRCVCVLEIIFKLHAKMLVKNKKFLYIVYDTRVVGPEIVMPNRRIWQSLGRETILECSITALPQAISYWQKDGRRITNTLHRPAAAAAAAAAGGGSGGGRLDNADVMTGPPRPPKYRIEAYDEGDHTLTLNLRLQVQCATTEIYYSAPPHMGARSIVMSVSVCLCVCLSVRDHIFRSTRPSSNVLCNLPVTVAQSSSCGTVICYVFLVLWITSYLHVS